MSNTDTKSLYVVSSYTVAAENEIGSGGFFWLKEDTTYDAAIASYYNEVNAFKGCDAVIRLVRLNGIPAALTGDHITQYIDAVRSDEVEFTLVPLATTRLSTASNYDVF